MKKLFCLLLCLCLALNLGVTFAEEDSELAEEIVQVDEEREASRDDQEAEEEVPHFEETREESEDGETKTVDEEVPVKNAEKEEESESPKADEVTISSEVAQTVPEEAEDEVPADEEEDDAEASAIPDDAQAWLEIDGAPYGGSLSEIIDLLEGGETVYIRTGRVVHVRDVMLSILEEVSFRPDREVFGSGYEVRLYSADPDDGGAILDFSEVSDWEIGDVWFHVEDADSEPDGQTDGEPDEEETAAIHVSPGSFTQGEWINKAPTFTLSGIPEDEDWMYAVIVYDDRIIPLSGNTYKPTDDGIYTLQFAIQDYLGDMIAVSDKLTPWFDWTKPKVTIETSKDVDYTLNVTATDVLSGVASLSMDGGKTWRTALDGATYTYSAESTTTLPAGQIRVKDYAGNLYTSDKSYELTAVKSESSAKSSGSSGGSSSSASSSSSSSGTTTHASDEDEDIASEGALNLVMSDEPMRQLIVDGQVMALTLTLETEDGAWPISFTGSFEPWYNAEGRMSYAPNMLLLDASLEEVGDVFSCQWSVNGEVFRVLNNAGVDYVAFRALDDVCVVSAAGFIGGTKYTELKMQGVSTRQFDYALTMKVNRDAGLLTALSDDDLSEDCDFALRVDVEDMAYELNASPRNPIYYYDICLGPEAMLSVPFGQYEG